MITGLGHPAFAARDVEETLMLAYLRVSGDRLIEAFPSGRHPTPAAQRFTRLCLLADDLECNLSSPGERPATCAPGRRLAG
jgi:hypothetical protein